MKVVATGFGGPEMLAIVQTGEPQPGHGQAAVAVRAAGVNPVDRKRYADPEYARSHGQAAPDFPLDLGVEIAGVVTAVGAEANGPAGPIAVGDEVIGFRVSGGYADRIVTDAANLVPKPAELSWGQAASMMLAGTTAAHTLAAVRARRGQTVLVHGAAGGVGMGVVQLARVGGVRVIGTAGEKDFDRLRQAGATPVRYGDGLEARVREALTGKVDAAIDVVGTEEAGDVSLALVVDRSRIATIVDFERARRDGFQALGGAPGQDEAGIAIRMNARLRLTALVQGGLFHVPEPQAFLLSEAADVHRRLDGGKGSRIVLRSDE